MKKNTFVMALCGLAAFFSVLMTLTSSAYAGKKVESLGDSSDFESVYQLKDEAERDLEEFTKAKVALSKDDFSHAVKIYVSTDLTSVSSEEEDIRSALEKEANDRQQRRKRHCRDHRCKGANSSHTESYRREALHRGGSLPGRSDPDGEGNYEINSDARNQRQSRFGWRIQLKIKGKPTKKLLTFSHRGNDENYSGNHSLGDRGVESVFTVLRLDHQ